MHQTQYKPSMKNKKEVQGLYNHYLLSTLHTRASHLHYKKALQGPSNQHPRSILHNDCSQYIILGLSRYNHSSQGIRHIHIHSYILGDQRYSLHQSGTAHSHQHLYRMACLKYDHSLHQFHIFHIRKHLHRRPKQLQSDNAQFRGIVCIQSQLNNIRVLQYHSPRGLGMVCSCLPHNQIEQGHRNRYYTRIQRIHCMRCKPQRSNQNRIHILHNYWRKCRLHQSSRYHIYIRRTHNLQNHTLLCSHSLNQRCTRPHRSYFEWGGVYIEGGGRQLFFMGK